MKLNVNWFRWHVPIDVLSKSFSLSGVNTMNVNKLTPFGKDQLSEAKSQNFKLK